MTLNEKNQNDIFDYDLLNELGIEYEFSNEPINRFKNNAPNEEKSDQLAKLRVEIEKIEDCELKNSAKNLVFSDGNSSSKIMIVGEGPGQKEDELGKPFVGDAGMLLNKMLKAINLDRTNVYITNVVNYRPPNNRKPEISEINRYSEYLRKHISIINPEILILMGSTAMEALFGNKVKISKERGKWKEIILNNKTYPVIITFSPSYLIRYPENKKFSWEDLKKIKQKIEDLNIKI